MSIREQLRPLRKALKLTQTDFGAKIGVSRNVINAHEQGNVDVPIDRAKAICAEFGVNMEWLQTGQGEMFSKPADTFIDELAEKYDIDDFLKRAITVYMSLSADEKTVVKKFIDQMNPPPDDDSEEIYKAACSSDNHPPEIRKLTKEERKRFNSADPVTSDTNDF